MTNYAMYPRYSFISDITLGQTTVVTFPDNHDFTDGEWISFRVNRTNGTQELNEMPAVVMSHTDTTITVNIESTNYTPFIADIDVQNPPMVVPSATGTVPGYNPLNNTNLADAFDNLRV